MEDIIILMVRIAMFLASKFLMTHDLSNHIT